jgi:DNA mismatch endonuclease Vsr
MTNAGFEPERSASRPTASSESVRRSMQSNRGRDTRPELLVRHLLRSAGYSGYRLHWGGVPGHPDIAFPGRRVAVFVNGCYWHRCPQCNPPAPKAHADFWDAKFIATEERDARNLVALETAGWTAITVWECELRENPAGAIAALLEVLRRTG